MPAKWNQEGTFRQPHKLALLLLALHRPSGQIQRSVSHDLTAPRSPIPMLFEKVGTPQLFLLDRDGCINRDVGAPGVINVDDLELLPGAAKAIRQLKQHGKFVAIITNQSCRGKGLLSAAGLADIHTKLHELLAAEGAAVDRVYVCEDAAQSYRKKPGPGMLFEAMAEFECAPDATVMIGDSWSDVVAAKRAGCQGALVTSGHGEQLGDALSKADMKFPATLRTPSDLTHLSSLHMADSERVLATEALSSTIMIYSDLAQAVTNLLL